MTAMILSQVKVKAVHEQVICTIVVTVAVVPKHHTRIYQSLVSHVEGHAIVEAQTSTNSTHHQRFRPATT